MDGATVAADHRRGAWLLPDRIPPLGGKLAKAFRVFWIVAATVAIAANSYSIYRTAEAIHSPNFLWAGIEVQFDGQPRIAAAFSEEASASGLRGGERLLAINGNRINPSAEPATIVEQLRGADGSSVSLTVSTAEGGTSDHQLILSKSNLRNWVRQSGVALGPYTVLYLLLIALPSLSFLVGAALLYRHRAETVPALLSTAFVLIAATGFIAFEVWREFAVGWLADCLQTLGWITLVIGFAAFPDGTLRPRWSRWLIPLTMVSFPILAFKLVPQGAVNTLVVLLLLSGLVALASKYRQMKTVSQRQQLRWALFGFAVGTLLLACGSAAYALMPVGLDPSRQIRLGLLFSLVLALATVAVVGGLSISLLRYRLYDAEEVISRSAAYALLTVLLLAVFAAVERVMEIVGERYLSSSLGIVAGGLGAAVAVLLVVPAHNRIHRWMENKFQSRLLSLRRDLPQLLEELRDTSDRKELLAVVLTRVRDNLQATHAAALTEGDGKWQLLAVEGVGEEAVSQWLSREPLPRTADTLQRHRTDELFPGRLPLNLRKLTGRPIGWILLGPRPDGSFFNTDERQALDTLATPLARSLSAVEVRCRREAAQDERLRSMEQRLTDLRADLEAFTNRSPMQSASGD